MIFKGHTELTHSTALKRLSEQVRATLGEKAFNAAAEQGKTLDLRSVVEALLKELVE